MTTKTFSLDDLCVLTDLPKRTVRYYVQIGLVDKPQGETRAAVYGEKQLEQLLLIKKWSEAGVSLERIRLLLDGAAPPMPDPPRTPGTVEVRSHLLVSKGIELVVEPSQAGLSPEQLRQFFKAVRQAYEATVDLDRKP